MIRDSLVRSFVHPVLLWSGSAVVLEQSLKVLTFDTSEWREGAQAIYGWLAA